MYSRPFRIIYFRSLYLTFIGDSYQQISTGSIQKTANFFRKVANFRRYGTLKLHIIPFSLPHNILYFF